jgi:hypothetical protein
VHGEERRVFAEGHMDKAPLAVVASCSTSLYGGTKIRFRSKLVDGNLRRVQCLLDQSAMHALYRNHFNAVDVMNRQSQGPGCLTNAWATYNVRHRLFAASMSACFTNAYQAWLQVHNLTPSTYSQSKFKLDLAHSMLQMMREMRAGGSSREFTPECNPGEGMPSDAAASEIFHGHLPTKSDKRLLCCLYKAAQTGLKCQTCGVYFCNPGSDRQCMMQHLEQAVAGTTQGVPKRSGQTRPFKAAWKFSCVYVCRAGQGSCGR